MLSANSYITAKYTPRQKDDFLTSETALFSFANVGLSVLSLFCLLRLMTGPYPTPTHTFFTRRSGHFSDIAILTLLYYTWASTLPEGGTGLKELHALGHLEPKSKEFKRTPYPQQTLINICLVRCSDLQLYLRLLFIRVSLLDIFSELPGCRWDCPHHKN